MYEQLTTGQTIPLEKVEALRQELPDLFSVVDTTLDRPVMGQVRFRGHFLQDPADCFAELKRRFEQHGFTPMIRQDQELTALVALPLVFEDTPSNWVINLVLFIATILSTLYVGASYAAETPEQALQIWRGWPFSLSLLLILGAHELGHYFAARYHRVPVTLPYFIPLPFPALIGTLGAFIRLKGPVNNRRALLDVGVAGPLAGLIFALPILWYGLATSDIGPLPTGDPYVLEGNSLLYAGMKVAVFGRFLPDGNMDVQLNDIAWAGWVGLLVTGLNLIPVGQLDGGHTAYVLFGKRAKQFFWPVVAVLLGLVLLTGTTTWIVWIVLLYLLGRNHAEPLDDVTELDPRRRAIAIFVFILFFFVFVPIPLQVVMPG
ncbi:MAG: site-2 protease family protein [Ardenticatenaceae bacterium]|nr:site-2 protease family protein [Ardenticatenaceae bacterium]